MKDLEITASEITKSDSNRIQQTSWLEEAGDDRPVGP
jgi:hypothetical protein